MVACVGREPQSHSCLRDCSHLGGLEGSRKVLPDPQKVESATVQPGLQGVKLAPNQNVLDCQIPYIIMEACVGRESHTL